MTMRRKLGLALVLLACVACVACVAYGFFAYAADDIAPGLLDFPVLTMATVPTLVIGLLLLLTRGRQDQSLRH